MSSRRSARRPSRRPSAATRLCEPLEPRLALSATVNPDGILVIVGSPSADSIGIDAGSANGTAILSGVPGVPNGTEFTGIRGLRVDLKSGDDSFSLTGSILTPEGQPGSILVLAGNGQDNISLAMNVGAPQVRGGNSHDTLSGGPANDLLKGGRGMDTIRGNAGEDRLEGQLGRDLLIGGPDNDSLFGSNQADELWGNDGNDLLDGGPHRDVLFGGIGLDQMFGRAASDTFNGAPDEAADFSAADVGFNALFDPQRSGVLLPHVFWDRFAEAETENDGVVDAELRAAMNVLRSAFGSVVSEFRQMSDGLEDLSSQERSEFAVALLGITNTFSPPILANPGSLTQSSMNNLRDDLNAAAPDVDDFRARFLAYNNEFFAFLQSPDSIVPRITPLPAGAPGTHGLLFGMDGVFNLSDEF